MHLSICVTAGASPLEEHRKFESIHHQRLASLALAQASQLLRKGASTGKVEGGAGVGVLLEVVVLRVGLGAMHQLEPADGPRQVRARTQSK